MYHFITDPKTFDNETRANIAVRAVALQGMLNREDAVERAKAEIIEIQRKNAIQVLLEEVKRHIDDPEQTREIIHDMLVLMREFG